MRYEEFLNQVMDKYAKTGLLLPDEMPEVELYMDQVVSLLNKELAVYKVNTLKSKDLHCICNLYFTYNITFTSIK